MKTLDPCVMAIVNAVILWLYFSIVRKLIVQQFQILSWVLNDGFQGLDLDVLELYHWWRIGDLGLAWIVLLRWVVSNFSKWLLLLLLYRLLLAWFLCIRNLLLRMFLHLLVRQLSHDFLQLLHTHPCLWVHFQKSAYHCLKVLRVQSLQPL